MATLELGQVTKGSKTEGPECIPIVAVPTLQNIRCGDSERRGTRSTDPLVEVLEDGPQILRRRSHSDGRIARVVLEETKVLC